MMVNGVGGKNNKREKDEDRVWGFSSIVRMLTYSRARI